MPKAQQNMYTLTKQIKFASAHQLVGHPSCGRLHGHNYKAKITITTDKVSDENGFVIDFGKFKTLEKKYDHVGLFWPEIVEGFKNGTITKPSDLKMLDKSAENIAEDIANQVFSMLQDEQKTDDINANIAIELWESENPVSFTLKKGQL